MRWSREAVVETDSGRLRGGTHDDGAVRRFLGVRYAEAPVGERRWRPPVPARGWTGTRDALALAPAAPQLPPAPTSLYFGGESAFDEDCLFLNVWTGPQGDAKRPVLVWLHFGAFQFGSAANPLYDGEALARAGATVVTVQYRLGRLGFLAHPELTAESEHGASGNYGLLDQIEALRWVRRHVAAFGGDPGNVTLIGCSAGAHSVYCLRSSPLARELFQRAIAHSGVGFAHAIDGPGHPAAMQTRAAGEAAGLELAAALGAADLQTLRALPAEAIVSAHLARQEGVWNLGFLPPAVRVGDASFDSGYPIIDGHVLARAPREVFAAGEQLDVPMIAGSTGNESSGLPFVASLDVYREQIHATFGEHADELLALYPAASDAEARASSGRLFADRMFTWATWTALRLHARTGRTPAYGFRFLREPPLGDTQEIAERDNAGAFHGAEIPYVFGTFGALDWPWTAADRRLGDVLRETWVAFARTGDPNGHGLPAWPPFGETAVTTMLIDLQSRVGDVPDRDRMAFWDSFYERWRG